MTTCLGVWFPELPFEIWGWNDYRGGCRRFKHLYMIGSPVFVKLVSVTHLLSKLSPVLLPQLPQPLAVASLSTCVLPPQVS